MTKFNPGDRVVVYGVSDSLKPVKAQGVVTGYAGTDMLYVEGPTVINGNIWDLSMPHVKQCRKLKPKVKKEPRRWWAAKFPLEYMDDYQPQESGVVRVSKDKLCYDDVELVEVLKNDK